MPRTTTLSIVLLTLASQLAAADRPNILFIMSDDNQYDNPEYAEIVIDLKGRLAKLRRRIGDTGEDFPAVEAIVDEFWDYDDADRATAIAISHQYLQSRENASKTEN